MSQPSGVLFEVDAQTADGALDIDVKKLHKAEKYEAKLIWTNIIIFGISHIIAVYGGYLCFFEAKWSTIFFSIFLYMCGIMGTTAGAHRLWAHRTYKAKWPLRLLLITMQTTAYQESVIWWCRNHRVHHKYSDTDADPHNSTRGFFYSHLGWLLISKHPDFLKKAKEFDFSDLCADPLAAFQRKHYLKLVVLLCFFVPTIIPMYFWNECFLNAFLVAGVFRWIVTLNVTAGVNSVAHKFGNRPYDKSLKAVQNPLLSFLAFGEGWHNYHHVFPWDYKTAELSFSHNLTKHFIELFAKIGWAYDLKSVSSDIVEKRVKRTGDGSHNIWGYGDKDLIVGDVLLVSEF